MSNRIGPPSVMIEAPIVFELEVLINHRNKQILAISGSRMERPSNQVRTCPRAEVQNVGPVIIKS